MGGKGKAYVVRLTMLLIIIFYMLIVQFLPLSYSSGTNSDGGFSCTTSFQLCLNQDTVTSSLAILPPTSH